MKKIIHSIASIISTVFIVFALCFILLFFFGIKPYVVMSGSMEPLIKTGSVSFINTKIPYENITEGDVIAFQAPNDIMVTHRVISITEDGLETKGDNNDVSDGISTTSDNYVGQNIFSIPYAGYGVKFIESGRGKIIVITLAIIILMIGFLTGDDEKEKTSNEKKDEKGNSRPIVM